MTRLKNKHFNTRFRLQHLSKHPEKFTKKIDPGVTLNICICDVLDSNLHNATYNLHVFVVVIISAQEDTATIP